MARVALTIVGLVLLASQLGATIVIPAEFREIVAGSSVIAHVRIIEVRPEWTDGRRRVDTVVTAEVLSPLKGAPDRTLTFKVPGGQLGRYRTVMVGAPVFTRGDEAVLFLSSEGGGAPSVFGLNQGVFRVQQEPVSGRRVVVPPPIMNGTTPQPLRRGSPMRRPVALEAFGAQVREVMAAQQAGVR
jgi:hypothetical protein